MEESGKKWYVLRTVGGKEKRVKESIESEIAAAGLSDHLSQVLIPTERVYQIKKGKKVSKERTFFPGYILIEAELVGEMVHILRNITNVAGLLEEERTVDGVRKKLPVPLRQAEVNRILGKMDENVDGAEMMDRFIVGENVKVIDGPFNSFVGVVEEVNEDKKKLKVTVKIFGRKTPLELSFSQVEKDQ